MSFKGWEDYKLGEIANFRYGKMPKKDKVNDLNSYPIYSGYRVNGYYPEYNSDSDLIVVARGVGGTGDVKISPKKSYLTNLSIIIDLNEAVACKYFLYYKYLLRNLKYLDTGSAQSQITINNLKTIKLNLPPLPEQKQIAKILSSLDDKIELNNRINKRLEKLAQTIFKRWFVDFEFPDENGNPHKSSGGAMIDSELGKIPKRWEVFKIGDVCYNHSKTFNLKEVKKIVFINTGDVLNGHFLHHNYSDTKGLPGQAKKVIEKGDILYSEIRPKNKRFAYVTQDTSDYVVSTKFMVLKSNGNIHPRLLYLFLKQPDTIQEFQHIAEFRSGTFPQITFKAIGNLKLCLPESYTQNKLIKLIESILKTQEDNYHQNKSLEKLRDSLLPKLMSGEIRVPISKKETA